MKRGMRGFGAGLGLAALCAAGLVAAFGHAASGTLTVPPSASGTGAAKCDKGEVATVGGFSSAPTSLWEILGLRPKGRRWSVALANNSVAMAQTAKLRAQCADADRFKTRAKRFEFEVPMFGSFEGSFVAKCPRGTSVAGGGFAPITNGGNNVLASRPVGNRKWKVTFFVTEDGPHTARVYALCDRLGGEYVTRTDFVEPDPPRATRGTSVPFAVAAECPGGSKLTGGGFSSGEELNERYEVVRPRRRSFHVEGQSFSSVAITAYARCLK